MRLNLRTAFLRAFEGVNEGDFALETERDRLSRFLPVAAFEQESQFYRSTDDTFGVIWECVPLYFSGQDTTENLESLLKLEWPEDTIVQVILFSDPDLEPFVKQYQGQMKVDHPVMQRLSEDYADFLLNAERYEYNTAGVELRNFRVFVTVKSAKKIKDDVVRTAKEALVGAKLQPEEMPPSAFLALLRKLTNQNLRNDYHYDPSRPLNHQVIRADSPIRFKAVDNDTMQIGDKYVSVITPHAQPNPDEGQLINEQMINELIGGWRGRKSACDSEQVQSTFIWTCTILCQDCSDELKAKGNLIALQRPASSLSKKISNRVTAFRDALGGVTSNGYRRYMVSLVVMDADKERLDSACGRFKQAWVRKHYTMQREIRIKHILWLMSLPFGYINKDKNLAHIDRYFIAPVASIAAQLPVQGDFKGFGSPVMPFVGRKGQVIGLDIFNKATINFNGMVSGASGGGKSVWMINFIINLFAAGVKIRLTDLGKSMARLCKLLGGIYIDAGDDDLSLNPFYSMAQDADDVGNDIQATQNVLAEMVYSRTGNALGEEEWSLLLEAVTHTFNSGNLDYGIDESIRFLTAWSEANPESPKKLRDAASMMAFNMQAFGSEGVYGKYFIGRSKMNYTSSRFVVFEMEHFKAQPELLRVVNIQLINSLTQEMYLGSRSERIAVIFEEVGNLFTESTRLELMVQEGYRRARKYSGAFWTIFQSIKDTQQFGTVGNVMRGNAAFKIFFESPDFEEAVSSKLLPVEPHELTLLKTVASSKPRYSEFFLSTPFGVGACRLILSPYYYGIVTSDGDETEYIDNLVEKEGYNYHEALSRFADEYKQRISRR